MKSHATREALAAFARGARPLLALRWVRVLLVAGALAVLVRLTLGLLLASAIDAAIAPRGLACSWDDLDLSILWGRGEVHYLQITPRPRPAAGAEAEAPIAVVEYAVFDLELLPLFVGKLRVRRLEIDGAEVRIARSADGTWNLARHFQAGADGAARADDPAQARPAEESVEAQPIALAPSYSVEALRLQDVYVRLSDRSFTPVLERVFHLDAGISNLWSSNRRMRFSTTLTGDKILDGAHLEGDADWTTEHIALDLRAQLGGLIPKAVEPYLAEMGIRPVANAIEGGFAAHLEVAVTGPAHDTLTGSALLTDLRLSADGAESAALDRAFVELGSFSRSGAAIPRVEIEGVRAQASIEPPDALRIAGLDLSIAPSEPGHGSWAQSLTELFDVWLGRRVPTWAALLVRDDPRAFPWSLGSFQVHRSELRLVDHRVQPAAEFPVIVDEIDVRDIVHERRAPAERKPPIPVHVAVRVPGTAESIRVEGSLAPFVPERSIELAVDVDGLGFEAMKGYLSSAGLEDTRQTGGLRLRLTGAATTGADDATEGRLDLEETLTLDGKETSQLGRLRARGLRFDPTNRLVRFGDMEVSGTRLLVARDPSRRMVALGLRTLGLGTTAQGAPKPRAKAPTATTAPAVPSAPVEPPAHLPRIEIGRLAWTDSHLAFEDDSEDPPVRLAVEPITFELKGLVLGGEAGSEAAPGRLVASAAAPGLFESFVLEGDVRTKLGGIDLAADLALTGTGIQGTLLAPYLRGLGIEPALAAAQAGLKIQAELRNDGRWRGMLRLHSGELSDAGATVAKLAELRIDDVVELESGLSIGRVSIVEPFAHIERSKENAIRAGGLRFVGVRRDVSQEATAAPSAPSAIDFPALPPFRIGEFALQGARISVRDESTEPAVDSDVLVDASAKDVSTTGEPGAVFASLRTPWTLESLEARGTLVLLPQSLRIDGSIAARGARSGPLASLLPPGTRFEMEDGRLSVAGSIEVGAAESGGIRARVEAKDLEWRDGASEPSLACRRASFAIQRFDPAAGVLAIGPAEVEGLFIDTGRDADGAQRLLGFRIEEVRGASTPPSAPTPPPKSKSRGFARIELAGDLAFAIERLRFRDAALGADAQPVDLGLRFRVPGPLVIRGGDPEALPPIAWSLEASVRGLVEKLRVEGSLRPFADDPRLDLTIAAEGIRTQGLVEFDPSLARDRHGDVENGTLEGRLAVQLGVRRREREDFGLDRPFSAEIRLDGLAYRAEPGGDVLAGIDSIAVDVEKVDLEHGLVHVKSVEAAKPRFLARRIGNAYSILGLSIGPAPPGQTETPAVAVAPERAPETKAVVADPSKSEFRIDRILVSGVDAELRDTTRDPVVVVPLAGLDIEAGPFSTRARQERIPLRFHAVVTGGVPTRAGVEGGSAGKKPAPVFDELVLAGDYSLAPEPAGWVQLTLRGLELPETLAIFPSKDVSVDEGSLDLRVRATFKGQSGVRVQSTAAFTDLSVSEPAGGPIEKGLGLPVALDAALFLLRNPAGEHRFSIGFTVGREGVSGGQIALAATGAVAQVIAVALAGAPLRLLSALAPKSGEKARGPRAVGEIRFAAGSSELPPDAASTLFDLRRRFAADASLALVVRHALSSADVERAEGLANPSAEECLALVARARQRR
jgi:hypothetical protein